MNNLEFLERINKGEGFEEHELLSLAYGDSNIEIEEEIEGDDHRWDREIQTILKIDDRYFAINWRRGLTECQENNAYEQPYEVEKKTKTVITTYYERLNMEGN